MWSNDDDDDDDYHFYPVDRLRICEGGNEPRRVVFHILKWNSEVFVTRGAILIVE